MALHLSFFLTASPYGFYPRSSYCGPGQRTELTMMDYSALTHTAGSIHSRITGVPQKTADFGNKESAIAPIFGSAV